MSARTPPLCTSLRRLGRSCAIACLVMCVVQLSHAFGAPPLASLQLLLERARTDADNAALVALTCLATAASLRLHADDSTRDQLKELADKLVESRDLNADGNVGWGLWPRRPLHRSCAEQGAADSFGTGRCNPPLTEYAFQTGLAAMCLARTTLLTGDETYSQIARRAVLDALPNGETPPGCKHCFYFMYSLERNDRGRFVRNVNVLMGAAAAWSWKATGDQQLLDVALRVVDTERWEDEAGNRGYFGIGDPQFRSAPQRESQRIENHVPWVAKGLLDIGRLTATQSAVALGRKAQWSWQHCKSAWTCERGCAIVGSDPERCSESATFSPCFWKNDDAELGDICTRLSKRFSDRGIGAYMAWALLD